MGRQPAARRGDRGGEGISTLRAPRVRLAANAAAVAIAAALAAYPMATAGVLAPFAYVLGGLGLLLAAVAILRHGPLPAAALFALAAEYVVVEATGHVPAATAIAYAVGLVVLCELLLWTQDLGDPAAVDRRLVVDQLIALAAIVLAAIVLALVALGATQLRLGQAFESALLGTAAAVGLLALPWLLLRARRGG